MDKQSCSNLTLLVTVILLCSNLWSPSLGEGDKEALLDLKKSFHNTAGLESWDNSSSPCNGNRSLWEKIKCVDGRIIRLAINNLKLGGTLDAQALSELTELRVLAFMDAGLSGNFPDLSNNKNLKNISLAGNRLSGSMPSNMFANMPSLKRLWLYDNNINGSIPPSLATPKQLAEVRLENNKLEGKIPPLNQPNLHSFNVSNNLLNGPIPKVLLRFSSSSFSDNSGLCGSPVGVACKKPHRKMTTWVIVGIVIADMVGLLIFSLVLLWLYRKISNKKAKPVVESISASFPTPSRIFPGEMLKVKSSTPEEYSESVDKYSSIMDQSIVKVAAKNKDSDNNKLVFFDGSKFGLEELLKASAEVMGKGSFGSVYRAMLIDGTAIVVKRLREFCKLGGEEFDDYMLFLGNLRHTNLLSLKAYYGKDEKLLLYDFIPNGSLHNLLHGKTGSKRTPLDWKARLKVIRGVTRGLTYLHEQCGQKLQIPHGHLKSSNVLVDENKEAFLCDFALSPLLTPSAATQKMVVFNAPEVLRNKQLLSPKADVWSFGVLLLEILTGKTPSYLGQNKEEQCIDLRRYVESVVREEWTGEVFDREISMGVSSEGEMLQILQIALWCADSSPEKRPDMATVLKKIEKISERVEDFESTDNSYDYTGEFSFSTASTPLQHDLHTGSL